MMKLQVPPGTPEAWELDDLSRLCRVREELDQEYLRVPEGPYRRQCAGSVPSVDERSRRGPGRP
jgi:hypothetical protein